MLGLTDLRLDVSDCDVQDTQRLCKFLSKSSQLQVLHLIFAHCPLEDKHFLELATTFRSLELRNLHLDMSRTRAGDAVSVTLLSSFIVMNRLTSLCIGMSVCRRLSQRGLCNILGGISLLGSLRALKLDLSYLPLGDADMIAFAESLTLQNLRVLDLDLEQTGRLTEDGLLTFISKVQVPSLIELRLNLHGCAELGEGLRHAWTGEVNDLHHDFQRLRRPSAVRATHKGHGCLPTLGCLTLSRQNQHHCPDC
uniref:Uncharacterized protein n=1 Tax=Noctiluca scintillans TaxID=2966 RepID=A0A7S1F3I7_NOCSC|mmetsp:Transcript_29282/g.77395  ORF Transcript_29282/g.77395 Transcript_29282/m.77395 type:complete len:252 (+) Transcript_29282:3-758(+)